MRKLIIASLILFAGSIVTTKAQEPKPTAKEFFGYGDYVNALKEYILLSKEKPNNAEYRYRIGLCYLYLNGDKAIALQYLEDAKKLSYSEIDILLNLGKAYHSNLKFDEAVVNYKKYLEKSNKKDYVFVDKLIENAEYAKVAVKNGRKVSFSNLGKDINSKFPDYIPYVTADNSTLYFTTARDMNLGSTYGRWGYKSTDIFFVKKIAGVWGKAKTIGPPINSTEDDICVGASADGKTILLSSENLISLTDIFTSSSPKGKAFNRPEPLNLSINSNFTENEACYNTKFDEVYFTSDRPGGMGGSDIYLIKKLSDGTWGLPINVTELNTPFNESFPQLSIDNKMMYFTSEGHYGLGGSDIFVSAWDSTSNKWESPINLGFPINTLEDDYNVSFINGEKTEGYIYTYRKEGFGDLDIYNFKIETPNIPEVTTFKGSIVFDANYKGNYDGQVYITNKSTGAQVDSKSITNKTGKFLFALTPGEYHLVIEGKTIGRLEDDIYVKAGNEFNPLITKKYFVNAGSSSGAGKGSR